MSAVPLNLCLTYRAVISRICDAAGPEGFQRVADLPELYHEELAAGDPTNGAKEQIQLSEPWIARVEITGSADLLFHRWNNEAVAEKAAARKGSAAKKTDNVESYVYRNDSNELCLPGEYLRGSIVGAAKFRQDPRSPRKSAMDLTKAGVISLTPLASLGGATAWDYEDRRRVVVQRNAVTRVRPAMRSGWKAEVRFDGEFCLSTSIKRSYANCWQWLEG